MNPDCTAKKIKAFTLFVSRDAMNIDGLSEATLEKFIARGFIHDFGDIFEIEKYRDEIVTMDGFGEKSFNNLTESLEKAKTTTLAKVMINNDKTSGSSKNKKAKELGIPILSEEDFLSLTKEDFQAE